MKNYVQPGKTIPVTVASAKSSGDGHETAAGGLVGVLTADVEAGGEVEMSIEGIFEFTKDAADSFAVGDKVYWNEAAGEATSDIAETHMGTAVEAIGAVAGTIQVKLLGFTA